MSAKDAELLNDKNWAKWSSDIIDKGLEFGDAGRSIRTGVKPDFRNPLLSDERQISSGIVMTRAQAAAIVNELTQEMLLDDEDRDPDEAQAEAAASFEPVYESESELQEARRQLSQRRIKFEEDKQKFLGYILSRLSENAKYKLKAKKGMVILSSSLSDIIIYQALHVSVTENTLNDSMLSFISTANRDD